jgi:hypothetical protein
MIPPSASAARAMASGTSTLLPVTGSDGLPTVGMPTVARRVVGAEHSGGRGSSHPRTTTTVHYLKFRFTPEQIDAFASGPARIVVDHPHYNAVVELTDEQREELLADLRN